MEPPPIDPGHARKRAILNRTGFVLLAIGIPVGTLGVALFLSCFFWPPQGTVPIRPPLGLILAAIGGFMSIFGLNALTFGNLGHFARYQAAEAVPVSKDVIREMAPSATAFVRTTASAAREGWAAGSAVHACGAVNEPGAKFCKGCGAVLRVDCPACGAPNDADARFCNKCGQAIAPAATPQ